MNKITVTEEMAHKYHAIFLTNMSHPHTSLIDDMQATLQSFADEVLAPALSQPPTILSAVKDESADPYAELKAAHAAGKRIQNRRKSRYDEEADWITAPPAWAPSFEYRIHPDDAQPKPWSDSLAHEHRDALTGIKARLELMRQSILRAESAEAKVAELESRITRIKEALQ